MGKLNSMKVSILHRLPINIWCSQSKPQEPLKVGKLLPPVLLRWRCLIPSPIAKRPWMPYSQQVGRLWKKALHGDLGRRKDMAVTSLVSLLPPIQCRGNNVEAPNPELPTGMDLKAPGEACSPSQRVKKRMVQKQNTCLGILVPLCPNTDGKPHAQALRCRSRSPEISPCVYSQLIFSKSAKTTQWEV